MFNLDNLLRENIKRLTPYSTARDEFKGDAKIFLDANENSYGSPLSTSYNRYPDPLQWKVKEKLSLVKGIPAANIFLGNGSDECIDVLYRICCEPSTDNVLIVPPTYGMYEVSATINDIGLIRVPLTTQFQLDLPAIEQAVNDHTKMIFLCSPNNPTGNSLHRHDVEILLNNYFGLVVIDEAYINFSRHHSFIRELKDYPNLVVMQTLSKAWGLAALRVGMAFASENIIHVMNKVKPPYNINAASQELALNALDEVSKVNGMILDIVKGREMLSIQLQEFPFVLHVYHSDANFLLVKVTDANSIYEYLLRQGIVVRDRSKVEGCEGCLRITIGTEKENNELIQTLKRFVSSK